MMKKIFLFLFLCFAMRLISSAQTPFTAGNVVVLRIGDNVAGLDYVATPVFLDEYTQAGVRVRSIAMPVTASGSNNRFLLDGYGLATGTLTLSPDGKYLAAGGFDIAPGTYFEDYIYAGTTGRTFAIVDYNGNVNTSTKLSPSEVGLDYPYSAVTSNGIDVWANFGEKGIRYFTTGATSSVSILANTSYQTVGIFDDQLYATASDGRVFRIGNGLPISGPQTATTLPGMQSSSGAFGQCFFADLNEAILGPDVLYVAVSNGLALKKYSFDGTNWVLNGTIGTSPDDYSAITGMVKNGTVTLFMTRKPGNVEGGDGELIKLTDNTGYTLTPGSFSGTPTVLATAVSGKTMFRGVAMAPALPVQPTVSVAVKAFLQGAYSTTPGHHKDVTAAWSAVLNANALSQPFSGAPFNYPGTESVAPGFFQATTANTDITDWVLLELHDATAPATVVASKAAFIREDGQIVSTDGTSNPAFTGVAAGNYHLVIRHRNHLSVRTASPIPVNASPTLYDFTTSQSQAYQDAAITGNTAMVNLGGNVFGLWGGDADNNGIIRFEEPNGDSKALLNALSGNQAAILNNVYNKADLNLDGKIRYTGLNNDAGILIKALGGNQQATVTQHQ